MSEAPKINAQDSAVYLIDASVYIFRAYFSLPEDLLDTRGQPVNAVQGFAGFLQGFLTRTGARRVGVAFDESLTTSFRNDIYPEYKANRPPAPEDLKQQFATCKALAEALGLVTLSSDRYEADDLIATLVARAQRSRRPAIIVSRDKDFAQLLSFQDRLWDFASDTWLDTAGVAAKFGVPPSQMLDYQALVGDAVDNIPGIKGVGPKAAVALLQHFGSLDVLYTRLQEVPDLSVRAAKRLHQLLDEGREMALLSRELCRMATDAPLPHAARDLTRQPITTVNIERFCDEHHIGPGLRQRLLSLV